jgi:hypothetical protein
MAQRRRCRSRRLDQDDRSAVPDLLLRFAPNWTAIIFLAGLGGLHLSMATHAIWHGRWEGFLSVIFGVVFTAAAVSCRLVRSEIIVLKEEAQIRLRTGFKRLRYERCIPFEDVRSVRLTLMNKRCMADSRIEIVCDREVIECPPTYVPRQESLCLAVTMGVHLVKVYGQDFAHELDRVNKLTEA